MKRNSSPGLMNTKPRILIADGDPATELLCKALDPEYDFIYARDDGDFWDFSFGNPRPDVILLDALFWGSDPLTLLARFREKEETIQRVPIIFSAPFFDHTAVDAAIRGGASDFLLKPHAPGILQLRIKTQLELSRSRAELESLVEERTKELKDSHLEVVRRLVRASEFRDNETGAHILRMSRYSQIIASAAGADAATAELVLNAAPMHDIGKIGVPDAVLRKPGPLNDEEWGLMRMHCRIGANIIGKGDSDIARHAAEAALTHHERYDGTGYPEGLSGETIPWIGRVIAVADVFDALTTERPYKKAWTPEMAIELIQSESGTHFDPKLVSSFLESIDEINEVRALYPD